MEILGELTRKATRKLTFKDIVLAMGVPFKEADSNKKFSP